MSRVHVNDKGFWLDGQRRPIHCGELHYLRIPRPYWRDRLRKAAALGLNTVCAYIFWNAHEAQQGVFDFEGGRDVASFVRLSQEEGLHVLLRPGPYVCAEWEMGGLPWWLLRDPTMRLRTSHAGFMDATRRYLDAVGKQLAELTVDRGGPILMVQVENEYGAYGCDPDYLPAVRDAIANAGFAELPMFTCDWATPATLKAGRVEGCVSVANFGGDAPAKIAAFRALRPDSPPMCGEFWSGWFDQWGQPHAGTDDPTDLLREVGWFLDNNVSFSLYMLHGGTSFGFTAGANHHAHYEPTITSYDYRAPLDESGRPTAKFHALRARFQTHLCRQLPDLPHDPPLIDVPEVELTQTAPLLDGLPEPTRSVTPMTFETLGVPHGLVLYRTDVSGLAEADGTLPVRIREARDYARVFLNGEPVATLDRRLGEETFTLQDMPSEGRAVLDVLIDTGGRVNFGTHLHDRKGISDFVDVKGRFQLMNWAMYPLPLDDEHLARLRFGSESAVHGQPTFFRGDLHVDRPGDTHLDLSGWGRGVVWVNGHNLGRFWSIGPQQTLFCPGCWLRGGSNEVTVFDLSPTGRRSISGRATPVYDRVAPDLARQSFGAESVERG